MVETRTIKIDALARVEGEGSLYVRVHDGRVEDVRLAIYEPPRFFEGLLKGRPFTDAPDITSRICGICPVAYQISAVRALEDAASVEISPEINSLRRLLYCGEWLQSHALHVFLLHAADFYGCDNTLDIAKDHPELVRRGLRLKQAGVKLLECVGGRAVHPVTLCAGGFHRAPTKQELIDLVPQLQAAHDDAIAAFRWAATLQFPEVYRDWALLALSDDARYAIDGGTVKTSVGTAFSVEDWPDHVQERQHAHSTALYAVLDGVSPYLTGPLARYALNADKLPASLLTIAGELDMGTPVRNPFRSIAVRCLEMVYACEEALGLINGYVEPRPAAVACEPRNAVGHGASEAPRGTLYHRYAIDADGRIAEATIVPPTAQNQAAIETDVRAVAEAASDLDDPAFQRRCEQAVRNHDPCISCATHFLNVSVEHV